MVRMGKQGWRIEDREVSQAIMDIVIEVGNRLKDPNQVRQMIEEDKNAKVIQGIKTSGWRSFSDYPAVCMLLGELAEQFPEQEWDRVAHDYMLQLQKAINEEPIWGMGMFGGAAGIGMAGAALSRGGIRYNKFLIKINQLVRDLLAQTFPLLRKRLGGKVAFGDYDVICGISGVGRYLLLHKDQSEMRLALERCLQYVIDLTEDIVIDGQTLPGWHIAREQQLLPEEKEKYPMGNFNIGLAHGIPGPLALLALALLHNIEIPGQRSAIRKITDWLIQFQSHDSVGRYWGGRISWEEQITGSVISSDPYRQAWCYGTPGVARAMYLAGCSISDESIKEEAIRSFDAVFARSDDRWGLPSSTFCHGLAGLLHLTHLMHLDTRLSRFDEYRKKVLGMMLRKYPEGSFGFYELEQGESDLQPVDRVGVIDGAAGSALSLLALVKPVKTNWDAMFLVN